MKRKLLQVLLLMLTATTVLAQAPSLLNYQGVARSTSGNPLASQTIGLRLSIHDGSGSGTIVYQETTTATTNTFGLYNFAVGSGTAVIGTFNSINWATGNKYMEVEIDPGGGTSYTSVGISQLLSVPYALYAENTQAVSGTTNYISKFTSANAIGNSLLMDNGSGVGLDTVCSSMAKFEVHGIGTYGIAPYYQAGIVADGPSSADGSGVYGQGGWRGVFGYNPGIYAGAEAMGVLGRCSGSAYTSTGYGVKGEMTGTGGTNNYGVYGTANGTGNGVGGTVTGTGIAGVFDGGSSGYGVIVKNGISGFNTVTPSNMCKVHVSGVGTYSVSPIYQAGIIADGGSSMANASGIYAEGGWRGVYGRNPGTATGSQAIGVHGKCEGSAYTTAGYGVLAEAVGTGPTNYGIYARASGATGANYAGYFSGNVNIVGSIAKTSGTFLIDHPLDPENKYLYHSFVESPDMMNVYNGNVVTDANGDATVTMPDYFEALNKDFRYQLTTIGQPSQVYVSQEISGNKFQIKSDKPNVKVSWQVTGVRQDKYANAHRVVPEVEKEAKFKGYYLNAAEWGQPQSKSITSLIEQESAQGNTTTK